MNKLLDQFFALLSIYVYLNSNPEGVWLALNILLVSKDLLGLLKDLVEGTCAIVRDR